MSGNNLGNTSLKLTTDGAELSAGLKKAEGEVRGWGGRVAGLLKGAFAGTIGVVAGTIFSAIKEPFEKLEELAKIQRKADVLGVSASQFAGIADQLKIIGIDADGTAKAFQIMGKNIEQAGGKAVGVIDGMDEGLEGLNGKGKAKVFADLGINLKELQQKDYAGQFKDIADALTKVPKGSEQAAAAMAIFGRSGTELLPVLQKGKEGIDEFIHHHQKLGAVLSDSQYLAAANAAKAWKGAKRSLEAVWDGLVNRATLVATPVIENVAKAWSAGIKRLEPVFAWLGDALDQISIIIDRVFAEWGIGIQQAAQWLEQWAKVNINFGENWGSVGDQVVNVFQYIAKAAAYVFDFIRQGFGYITVAASGFLDVQAGLVFLASGFDTNDPDVIRMNERAKATRKWGQELIDAGAALKGVKAVEEWFARTNFKRQDIKPLVKPEKPKRDLFDNIKAVEAMQEGTQKAWEVEARFRTADLLNGDGKKPEERAVEELQKNNDLLRQMLKVLTDEPKVMLAAG